MLGMQTIHILDNRDDCIAGFQQAVAASGNDLQLRVWRNANSMIAGCSELFPNAALLSLNCESDPRGGDAVEMGTALDVARFIGDFPPACPVIIHSNGVTSNGRTGSGLQRSNGVRLTFCTLPSKVQNVSLTLRPTLRPEWLARFSLCLTTLLESWRASCYASHSIGGFDQ